MISKKFFEFCYRPIQLLGSLNMSYHCSTFQSTNSFNARVEQRAVLEQQRNREDDYNNNRNSRSNLNLTAALLPVLYFINKKSKTSKCDSEPSSEKVEKNKLNNRISTVQYPANNPIEDRYDSLQLTSIDGYYAAVFDGHGGWQVAELARANLGKILDEVLKENKGKYTDTDQYITESIKTAFDRLEESYLEAARKAYAIGFPKVGIEEWRKTNFVNVQLIEIGRAGACALVSVVHNNKLYVANAGDCKGLLVSVNEKGEANHKKLSKTFNANSKKEQARLKETFKGEDNIYVCKPSGACYVKGKLMPTRAFGDLRLKHQEFNNPNDFDTSLGYQKRIQTFNGPYITHTPDIKVVELTADDRYMILSSDGMWDELKKSDVAQIVKENPNDKAGLPQELLKRAMAVVSEKSKLTAEELEKTALGKRRDIHDDMTILVVDVRNQH